MSEPEDIVEAVCEVLNPVPQDLAGKCIVITAGPTHEPIDPVRFIGNRSSGKMGIAWRGRPLAAVLRLRLCWGRHRSMFPAAWGACACRPPQRCCRRRWAPFRRPMRPFARQPSPTTPPKPCGPQAQKGNERLDCIELVETVDILAELSRQKGERCVIGFAAETDNVVEYAQRKLARKGCDAIIANDVSRADSGFGTDTNKAWIVSTAGTQELPVLTKPQLADTILDLLQNL